MKPTSIKQPQICFLKSNIILDVFETSLLEYWLSFLVGKKHHYSHVITYLLSCLCLDLVNSSDFGKYVHDIGLKGSLPFSFTFSRHIHYMF
jgi:hypothetical protein